MDRRDSIKLSRSRSSSLAELREEVDRFERNHYKKLSPITRFRALVRRVIDNLGWLSDIDEELGYNVAVNVKLLSQKKGEKSLFTLKEKSILMKPAEDRTDEENRILFKVMKGLKCFRRYPEDVKNKLNAVSYFVYYGPGRVVVRQGNYAHATYFILSGTITISITTWDGLLKESVTKDVGTMGPGDMFGEVSLLHDIPRTATCTTSTVCEFLYLRRDDFVTILKQTLTKIWDKCMDAMKMFPYFDKWDNVAVRECCILSKMRSYEPNDIIFGFGKGNYLSTYFILSGECHVIQHMKVVTFRDKTKYYPQCLYSEDHILKEGESVESHFMQVLLFRKGECFGIGEKMHDRGIIASTHVECLLCPRQWLMQYNNANIWNRIKCYLDRQIPDKQQVYNAFIEQHQWVQYRHKVINDILRKKLLFNTASRHDVPYSIRLFEEECPRRGIMIVTINRQPPKQRETTLKKK